MQDLEKKLIEHLKHRLYESALNNVSVKVEDAGVVFADIADNRIETWINEVFKEVING